MSNSYVKIKDNILETFSKLAFLYKLKRDDIIHEALVSYIVKLQSEELVNKTVFELKKISQIQDENEAKTKLDNLLLEYISYFHPKISTQLLETKKELERNENKQI